MKRVIAASLVLLLTTFALGQGDGPRKVLRVGLAGETNSLDHINTTGGAVAYTIFQHLFDKLVFIQPSSGEIEPMLATSWAQPDSKTYEFELRNDVVFHNGDQMTAADVVFSLEMVRGDSSVWLYNRISSIDLIEAIDDYTVRITTSEPDVMLLAGLGEIPIYPQRYYEEVGSRGFGINPIGTGPYKLKEWLPAQYLTLERHEAYWDGVPNIHEVIFRPYVEASTRIAALEAGEIDVAVNIPPDDARRLEERGINIVSGVIGQSMNLVLKQYPGTPLVDKRVRQALNYAIDKEALVRDIMQGFGEVLEGQLVASDAFGYNPDLEPYPYDPGQARALLAEAGYPDGFSIDFESSTGRYTKQREVSEAIAGQLAEVGVTANLTILEWSTYATKLLTTLDIAPLSYIGWNYFPAMDSDFVVKHYQSGSPYELFGRPESDRLFELQSKETDREERRELLEELHAVLHEEAPVVFLFQSPIIYATTQQVTGVFPAADDRLYLTRIANVDIDMGE